ncbi:transmembrane protein 163-like isoform X3 [Varroa jacobsoni]|uniref:transmembrane protein 163-like isoform X3 n=1 Tax=Varroa jacobsoni TaxID=62625 RepID=UPI000BF74ADC|nr:transmembrane protein 163-like isoform X3 [Varroa jacobsoni]
MVKHMSSDMLPFGEGQKTSTVEVIRRSSDPLGIGPFDLTQKGLFTDLVTARLTARRLILGVTVLSVVVDVALAAIGVALASECASAAIYAFSFQGNTFNHKEFLVCSLLGILFIVSGIGVVIKAVTGIISRENPVTVSSQLSEALPIQQAQMPLLEVLSSIASIVCATLALVKLWAARRVTMLSCGVSAHSLVLDAIGSLLSAFCALAALIGAVAYHQRRTLWFLDSTMTSFAGLVMVAIGGRVLYQHVIH